MSNRISAVTMSFLLTSSLAVAAIAEPATTTKAKKSSTTTEKKETKTETKENVKEQPAKTDAAPRLTIVEPVKDYGTVPKGEKLDATFMVKNTGTADLQIIAARPGCGCTVADFDKVIKPGETGKINAHVDTTNFAGPISKGVTLETNDPQTPTAQLTLHAIVKPYVEAYPAGFVRFNMLQGDSDTQSVTLYSEEEEPFQITKIETPGDWVKVTQKKVEDPSQLATGVGKAGQAQYRLDFTVGPEAKIGPLADKVHITTNSKHQPDYFISLSGVVRPTFRVEPSAVNFGEVAPDETAATRSVLLHSNDSKNPDRFMVTKTESTLPNISSAVKPGANKGEYEVTLQVAKSAKPGDIEGTVRIFTTDKVNPVITVPVKGTIKQNTAAAAVKPSK